jgi:small-conductance mechanosensitive channel
MTLFSSFTSEIIGTAVVIFLVIMLRLIIAKLVRSFTKKSERIEHRTRLIIKYIDLLINILATISLIIIWGVQTKDIFVAISSIATVIGVAMVATWSILSNITSGIILFFAFPYTIGDFIVVHDKDFPIEAEIEDIGAFHIYLRTVKGELIVYPNNLLLQKGVSIKKTPSDDLNF